MNEQVFQFCPKCGKKEFHPLSPKKFQCRSCQFLYYFNPVGAVAGIVFNDDHQILLTKRARNPAAGTYDLPGGFIDFNETAEGALQRELREELNLHVCDIRYFRSLPNRYLYVGVIYHTIDLFFFCRAIHREEIVISDEISGYDFVEPDKIELNTIGLDSIRKCLAELQETGVRNHPSAC
jgi:mutator protein MutT